MCASHHGSTVDPEDATLTRARQVRTVRNVGYLAVAEVVGKVGSLAIIVLAGRLLGSEAFGAFSFALAAGLLLSMLPAWGSDSVITREGARVPEELPDNLARALALRWVGVLVLSLGTVVWLMLDGVSGSTLVAGLAVVMSTFLDTIADAYRSALGAVEEQRRPAIVLIVQRVATAVAVACVLVAGAGLLTFALVFLSGSALGAVLMAEALRREGMRPRWAGVRLRSVGALMRSSGYVGLNSVVAMALFRIDAVLLGILDSAASVGHYAAAYRLIETVLFAAWSAGRALLPVFSNTGASAAATIAHNGVCALLGVFAPYAVLLAMRGDDIMALLFGREYAVHASAIVAWVALTPALFAIGYLLGILLIARDRPHLVALTSTAALVVNIVLNLVLIPRWGALGAAVATTLSYGVCAFLTLALARQLGGTWDVRSFIPVVAGAVAVAGICLMPAPVVVVVLIAAAAYVFIWWMLASRFAPTQRDLLLEVLRRPGGDL